MRESGAWDLRFVIRDPLMAFLGRDSQTDLRRIERLRAWMSVRTPLGPISVAAGIIAIVDCWTLVLGIAAGIAAIALGVRGLRDLREQPQLLGLRLCVTGIGLGVLGLMMSFVMWMWVYPWLLAHS